MKSILWFVAIPIAAVTFVRLMVLYASVIGISDNGADVVGALNGSFLGIGLAAWRINKFLDDHL